jgi:glutaminyl-peptide cyclotransferase
MKKVLCIVFCVLSSILTASPVPSANAGHFSGTSALSFTAHAVSFGERPSGSDANTKLRNWIVSELKPLGARVELDSFMASTPTGSVPMINIIAHFAGSSGKLIAITGHYDTKRIPFIRFLGANDGASSTGFLLELARLVAHSKRTDDIDLVWFDGEEAVAQWTESDSRYGSRHLAQKWSADGTLRRLKALINVDMIGDRDLVIVNDGNSSQSLRTLVWQAAQSLGLEKYFSTGEASIDDDHVPFVSAGANAIDLIDFDYGPGNSFWHTDKDTLDKLSAHSLQVIGDVVVRVLAELQQ